MFLRYAVYRFFTMLLTLLVVSVLIFVIINLPPGDYVLRLHKSGKATLTTTMEVTVRSDQTNNLQPVLRPARRIPVIFALPDGAARRATLSARNRGGQVGWHDQLSLVRDGHRPPSRPLSPRPIQRDRLSESSATPTADHRVQGPPSRHPSTRAFERPRTANVANVPGTRGHDAREPLSGPTQSPV